MSETARFEGRKRKGAHGLVLGLACSLGFACGIGLVGCGWLPVRVVTVSPEVLGREARVRGDDAQARGDLRTALAEYRRACEVDPDSRANWEARLDFTAAHRGHDSPWLAEESERIGDELARLEREMRDPLPIFLQARLADPEARPRLWRRAWERRPGYAPLLDPWELQLRTVDEWRRYGEWLDDLERSGVAEVDSAVEARRRRVRIELGEIERVAREVEALDPVGADADLELLRAEFALARGDLPAVQRHLQRTAVATPERTLLEVSLAFAMSPGSAESLAIAARARWPRVMEFELLRLLSDWSEAEAPVAQVREVFDRLVLPRFVVLAATESTRRSLDAAGSRGSDAHWRPVLVTLMSDAVECATEPEQFTQLEALAARLRAPELLRKVVARDGARGEDARRIQLARLDRVLGLAGAEGEAATRAWSILRDPQLAGLDGLRPYPADVRRVVLRLLAIDPVAAVRVRALRMARDGGALTFLELPDAVRTDPDERVRGVLVTLAARDDHAEAQRFLRAALEDSSAYVREIASGLVSP